MKTKFVISSTTSNLDFKAKANKMLLGWENSGQLYSKCRVYEVVIKKVYKPKVRKMIILEELDGE